MRKIVALAIALLLCGAALAETYPQFVANDVTTGATFVYGEGNSLFDYRMHTLHVRAGSSGITFAVWSGSSDFGVTESWSRVGPRLGAAADDTTYTLAADEKVTFVFPQWYDAVTVSAGGGDLWGE